MLVISALEPVCKTPAVRTSRGRSRAMWGSGLDLDQLKLVFARAAIRAGPGLRHVLPASAWRYVRVGKPLFLVIDKAADHTHIGLHGTLCAYGIRPMAAGEMR